MPKYFKDIYIVNSVFTIVCVIQFFYIFDNLLYPTNPEIKVYEKQLKDIDFPLTFVICAHIHVGTNERYVWAG